MAPLGDGVVDTTAGSALVIAYLTGRELKHSLEFLLVDNPVHPGEYFPRTSGMRFHYDPSRPKFDVVTAIEIGDLDRGYRAIDITGKDQRLCSLTCPLFFGVIAAAIPEYTKGNLTLVPKNKEGRPLTSRVEALDDPRDDTPDLLPPPGMVDKGSVATGSGNGAVREIKEWQAIMDHLRSLPVNSQDTLPTIPVDEGLQRSGPSEWVHPIRTESSPPPCAPRQSPARMSSGGVPFLPPHFAAWSVDCEKPAPPKGAGTVDAVQNGISDSTGTDGSSAALASAFPAGGAPRN